MEIGLVTYKTAKLAQDKGFIGNADVGLYDDKEMYHPRMAHWLVGNKNLIDAPTQSSLQKWLREVHNIFLTITIPYEEYGRYSAEVWGNNLDDGIKILMIDGMTVFKTYEEALDEGLIEALKLIK